MKNLFSIIAFMLIFNVGNTQVRIGFTSNEIESELKELHVPFTHEIDTADNSVMKTKFFNGNSEVIHHYLKGVCITTIIIPQTPVDAITLRNEYNSNYRKYGNDCWIIDNDIHAEMHQIKQGYCFTYN